MQGIRAKAKDKTKEAPPPYERGKKGDLLIRDLWRQGTDSFHDMHVVNTDAVSYKSKTPDKCLETADHKEKN